MYDLLQVEKWTLLAALAGAAGVWFSAAAPWSIEWCCRVVCALGSVASSSVFLIWEAWFFYDDGLSTPGNSALVLAVITGFVVLATCITAITLVTGWWELCHAPQISSRKNE